MRTVACETCSAGVPTNDSVFLHDRRLCIPCAERAVADAGGRVPREAVRREPDPTICAKCGVDADARELPQIAGLPLCDACADGLRRYPFPWWVKLSFAAVMALCGAGLMHNWRFIRGYVEALQSRTAIRNGDVERAHALAASAAGHVPESEEIVAMSSLFRGLRLMQLDQPGDALPHLRVWKRFTGGADVSIERYILEAEAGVAFDKKNYDAFLDAARRILAAAPNESHALGSVASALACKYATTGQEQFRREALEYLEKARAASAINRASADEYEQRIRYRLDSRQIITRAEFQAKFPNGYPATGPATQEVERVHPR